MNTKKIDIYVNGAYICSTERARTCREAVQNFKMRPEYAGLVSKNPARLGIVAYMIHGEDTVTARFAR